MPADYTKLNLEKYAEFGQLLADTFGTVRIYTRNNWAISRIGCGKRPALRGSGFENRLPVVMMIRNVMIK